MSTAVTFLAWHRTPAVQASGFPRVDIWSQHLQCRRMSEFLGPFEQAVLLAIVRLGDGAYGRAIFSEMQDRLERELAAGAVHSTLDRLETKRLIASRLEAGTPVRGGRARRFYRLQPRGVRALNDARRAINSVWQGVKWPLKETV